MALLTLAKGVKEKKKIDNAQFKNSSASNMLAVKYDDINRRKII